MIEIEAAPTPDNINWKNMDVKKVEIFFRRRIIWFITIALWLGSKEIIGYIFKLPAY